LSDLNILLQVAIFVVLSLAAFIVKRKELMRHGYLMAASVALNAASILVVMTPVAGALIIGSPLNQFTALVAVNAALGLAVEAVGIALVARWRFGKPGPTCFKYKRWMRVLIGAWTLELLLGILIYAQMYM
jgi:uncharacterized membrane protein YozB (DUF420 family)